MSEQVERFLGDELRDGILAVLPSQCFVTRTSLGQLCCTSWIGGTFGNATWTAEMCCLPCRIRAVVDAIYPPPPEASAGVGEGVPPRTNGEVWTKHGHPCVPCSPPEAVRASTPCRLDQVNRAGQITTPTATPDQETT